MIASSIARSSARPAISRRSSPGHRASRRRERRRPAADARREGDCRTERSPGQASQARRFGEAPRRLEDGSELHHRQGRCREPPGARHRQAGGRDQPRPRLRARPLERPSPTSARPRSTTSASPVRASRWPSSTAASTTPTLRSAARARRWPTSRRTAPRRRTRRTARPTTPTRAAKLFPTAKVIGGLRLRWRGLGGWRGQPPLARIPTRSTAARRPSAAAAATAPMSPTSSPATRASPPARPPRLQACSSITTSCSGIAMIQGIDAAVDPNGDGLTNDARRHHQHVDRLAVRPVRRRFDLARSGSQSQPASAVRRPATAATSRT